MFEFRILSTTDELNSCAGSAYYPVELSKSLKKILMNKKEEKYAVIALPCVVYALRLAMEKIPKLKKNIKIIASLTCGQLQNRFCTEFLALESGIQVENLSRVDFRRKSENNTASNFLQVSIDKKGNEGLPQAHQKLAYLSYYHYFKQNACNFCDDVFGEVADITFMDAWLPEYIKEYRGTSLIIVRTSIVKDQLENSEECIINDINVNRVIESQIGTIQKKKILLKGKIYKTEKLKNWHPEKRIEPDAEVYENNKEFIDLTDEIVA
jgi:coenzyme F420 hydrogenase subunit beta